LFKILRVLYLPQKLKGPHGVSMEGKWLAGHHQPGPVHLLEGRAEEYSPGEERTSKQV